MRAAIIIFLISITSSNLLPVNIHWNINGTIYTIMRYEPTDFTRRFLYVTGHECLYAGEAEDAGALVLFRADGYDTAC